VVVPSIVVPVEPAPAVSLSENSTVENITLHMVPFSSDFTDDGAIVIGDYVTDAGIIDRYIHEPR